MEPIWAAIAAGVLVVIVIVVFWDRE